MRNSLPLVGATILLAAYWPFPVSAQDFTGPRVEVRLGWDQIKFDLADVGQTGTRRIDGLNYGVSLGYDLERPGGLVFGGDVSLDFTGADLAVFDPRRDIGISGRIGTRISDNALLFGRLGYTNLRTRTLTTLGDGTDERNIRTLDGVRLGVGAEVGMASNLYLKAEYDYSNYEDGVTRNRVLTGLGFRF